MISLILGVLNLVLLVVVLIIALRSKPVASQYEFDKALGQVRDELSRNISASQANLDNKLEAFRTSLDNAAALQREEANKGRIEIQNTLKSSVESMQKSNEGKLEEMRVTVDEKLQGTLEKRLGESFKLVSERLESVQQGLGRMQELATGVGNLQRVLTNVKNRGGWGEVQLSRQLEDMLSPEQYESNVRIKKNSNEVVEFAVILPGRQDDETVLLPIDSKFPQEDYERLLAAQDEGDPVKVETAAKEIEKAVKLQAKTISDKYIDVPKTTDFAIMYLPTEGLFAEVIRRPGLANELQNKFRVMVTGPTTLMSLLNSLQLGFKTLAIEKSTSDVWKILSAAKAEFRKYGEVWAKLEKQLSTAQKTVSDAGVRTRQIERSLRNVETTGAIESAEFIELEGLIDDAEVLELEAGDDADGSDVDETQTSDEK